jgi:23S rRNA pseudouridine2604 synthase
VKLKGVFPLGRLDKESHGLILLTNDGRVTERLLSPEAEHEKEYVVKVDKPLKQNTLTRLGKGVKIEGYITKPAIVEELGARALRLTITEGKRHQIRRMLTALGYVVTDLKRIRIMNIRLGELHDGEVRPLTATEKKTLLADLGL